MVQQAAVLDLHYVLFCVGTTSKLAMVCLVHVTAEQCAIYSHAIGA